MSDNSNDIQGHESPLRKMISNTHGSQYEALPNLDQAKKTNNAYLIMEGDDGGQIYLVSPVEIIKCDEKTLELLLKDLDAKKWKDLSMAGLYYEVHEPNTTISGGMGGGRAEIDLWVHKDFEELKSKIQNVISGLATSINNGDLAD
jgi:hypothetical protein